MIVPRYRFHGLHQGGLIGIGAGLLFLSLPLSLPARPAADTPQVVPETPIATVVSSSSGTSSPPRSSRPLTYTRAIRDDDLRGRTLRELSILRNGIFARAGSPIRTPWLRAYFESQPWYAPRAPVTLAQLDSLDRYNAVKIATWEMSIPRDTLEARRRALLARARALSAEERIELHLLDEHLGEWHPERRTMAAGHGGPSPLEDPSQLDAPLRVEQLHDLSRRELRLLRNLIFARRGRPFASKWLRLYFARYAWYAPDSTYTDARLTPVDRRNLAFVRRMEDEVGGPLTDEEDPDWFVGA